jgi:hypothetical protein
MSDGETANQEFQVLMNSATTAVAEIAEKNLLASNALSQIDLTQKSVAEISGHIEEARLHAITVRKELDVTLAAVSSHAENAQTQETKAASHAANSLQSLTDITATQGEIIAILVEVKKSQISSDASAKALAVLAEKAEDSEKTLAGFEAEIKRLIGEADTQLKTIVGLLPGAASAGLAHSFDERRKTFLDPSQKWQYLFIGSIGTLVLLAGWGLWNVTGIDHVITYDELFRIWLSKLPIVGALIWLAVHASHESALAKRLEEDYGYKAAIAACFQGFQERMQEVSKTTSPDTALAQLCANTLAIIASPPGRIYDKHSLTATPSSGAIEVAKAAKGAIPNP